jgi:hypothetical protein
MNYLASLRAALKASSPVVAIPVEGRVPVCIRARLLKGALKGVTVDSVEVLENGCLKVTGYAGRVKTSSTFVPMARYEALIAIREWSIKEREKRIRVINQGVLSAQAQRELKKAKIEAEADTVLKEAQKEVESIYQQARTHINPTLYHTSEERRQDVLNVYSSFRATRKLRKRGAVIRWKIAQLRAELAKITVTKGKRREPKKTFARKAKDVPKMLLMMREIASLEKKFEILYPPIFGPYEWWTSSWTDKRPKVQTCSADHYWGDEDDYDRQSLAHQLREARANILALTPPEDQEYAQEQIAA